MNKHLSLFWAFMKIGAFTFGGGYAMIPLIQREIVERKKWISNSDILEIIAISESTPGPMAINCATFVGYKTAGFLGALSANFGVVTPSFFIILIVSRLLTIFQNNLVLNSAFSGIRLGVLALLIKTIIIMVKNTKLNLFAYCIMTIAFIAVALLKINTIYVIIGCAIIGIILSAFQGGK